jgi:phenylalanyl-tRNA synthetase beta chain
MLVTLNWLKEFVEIDISVEELSEKLTMMGLEVAATTPAGLRTPEGQGLLGKVSDVKAHPKSDKLKLCKIATRKGAFEVITNSPNIEKAIMWSSPFPARSFLTVSRSRKAKYAVS